MAVARAVSKAYLMVDKLVEASVLSLDAHSV